MAMKVTSYYHRTNPDEAGYSLGNFFEIWASCFDAAGVSSVIEVGAERGRLTQELLRWAQPSGARVIAIEPAPISDLLELVDEYPELELVEETSLDALEHLPIADAVVLDGDHNYYTLSNELRLIAERAPDGRMPLLVFHDVCWPLARRDQYAAPERIPDEHRHPYGEDIKLLPGNRGTAERGLPFEWGALEEGGPRNGVMTAIEDFMSEREGLRLAVIPIFFGCGLLWPEDAPWSDDVAEIVEPWDRNPILERVEKARVTQLVQRHSREQEIDERFDYSLRLEEAIRRILASRAFKALESLSRLRRGGRPAFSRQELSDLLAEGERIRREDQR
ncbi:MAG TPA: class I SAM-dependent methyltransferase [Solirubrobacterales bacterium]|nr:class I SAM-dependent methyltransferase [Solirubrobacterales bacterium]